MKIQALNSTLRLHQVNNSVRHNSYIDANFSQADSFTKSSTDYKYKNALSFHGVDAKGRVKQRGLMFHITGLPATRSYCGQFLDPETDEFIDFLAKAKQTHWIMNPLFALGDDLCPYNSSGRFSKNKYIVNLNMLTKSEYGSLLKESELPDDVTIENFTLDNLKTQKDPRFKKAFERFEKLPKNHPLKKEYKAFEKENADLWLDTYSAYDAISSLYGDNWRKWPKNLQLLPENSQKAGVPIKAVLAVELLNENSDSSEVKDVLKKIDLYKFEQFLFDKQFKEFNKQLKDKNITLTLDLAIGVSPNGVDVWANKDIFLLDDNFNPIKTSGCPPEPNNPHTQSWGHPLFDYDSQKFWDYQEKSLKKMIAESDLRLDHFVGYINRAEIPQTYVKSDGTVLKGDEIFAPVEKGGMGADFFEPDWIVRLDKKTNKFGENMFDLFVRVAKEAGKKPEDCYILEDFGPLGETPAYKEFKSKYGKNFISQRLPLANGIGRDVTKAHDLSDASNPYNLKNQVNTAILTGNHDLASLREFVDFLLNNPAKRFKDGKNSPAIFKDFCKKELKLNDSEMKDNELVAKELMKWHYTQDVKQVQTTLQDVLGLYFRPNIPGSWHGMKDKWLKKATPEAMMHYWGNVFPKGFLHRENESGINPGYKKPADEFVKTMQDMYE